VVQINSPLDISAHSQEDQAHLKGNNTQFNQMHLPICRQNTAAPLLSCLKGVGGRTVAEAAPMAANKVVVPTNVSLTIFDMQDAIHDGTYSHHDNSNCPSPSEIQLTVSGGRRKDASVAPAVNKASGAQDLRPQLRCENERTPQSRLRLTIALLIS
jgi:hypothetical protein